MPPGLSIHLRAANFLQVGVQFVPFRRALIVPLQLDRHDLEVGPKGPEEPRSNPSQKPKTPQI